MPITPHFELSQTSNDIRLTIAVPHVRVSADSIEVVLTDDNACLHFASPPYLLVLNFQNAFADGAYEACGQYDPVTGNGRILLTLQKAEPGIHWEDLDLVGALMRPKHNNKTRPLINTSATSKSVPQGTNKHLQEFLDDALASNAHLPEKSNWIREILQETETTPILDDENTTTNNEDNNIAAAEENNKYHANDNQAEGDNNSPTRNGGYGFGRMFQGIFQDLARDGLAREMLEIPIIDQDGKNRLEDHNSLLFGVHRHRDVDKHELSLQEERRQMEAEKFSSERYLQDLDVQDDYLYQTAISMRPHWKQQKPKHSAKMSSSEKKDVATDEIELQVQLESLDLAADPPGKASTPPVSSSMPTEGFEKSNDYFEPSESLQLASIPYPLLPSTTTNQQQQQQTDYYNHLWLGLLDLLFAYCYDHLLTDGDATVESAWTISILSCSLSWLESFDDESSGVEGVLYQSMRRSLVYPYLRNVDFAIFVWRQVQSILTFGCHTNNKRTKKDTHHDLDDSAARRCVIRCLLQIRTILDQSELYYLGNKLFVDPYLAWLQDTRRHAEQPDGYLAKLAKKIDNILSRDLNRIKDGIGLDLLKLEREPFDKSDDEDQETKSSSSNASSSGYDSDTSTPSEDSEEDARQEVKVSSDLLDDQLEQHSSVLVDLSKLSLSDDNGTKAIDAEDCLEDSQNSTKPCLIQEIS